MSKIIEKKADKAFPYAKDDDATISAYAERRAYIKGYEDALTDVKLRMKVSAIIGEKFSVLSLYKWLDKRLVDK